MDPTALLAEILTMIGMTDPDRHELEHALLDLAHWIGTGGFLPHLEDAMNATP